MDEIAAVGITDVGVVIAPETGAVIKDRLGDGSRWDINIRYILQDKPLGLAHAVLVARDFLADYPFLLYLGDNLVRDGVGDMLNMFLRGRGDACVMIKKVSNPKRFGVAVLDEDANIVKLVEKPAEPISNLALVGVYLFNSGIHQAIDSISPSPRGELEITDAIQRYLEMGARINSSILEGWWFDTGCKEDLLEANRMLLDERCQRNINSSVCSNSRVDGRVEIGEDCSINNSVILGPAVVGKGAVVNNSLIGPYSSIGEGCNLGAVRVENSILLHNCSLSGRVHVMESLMGRFCRIAGNGIERKAGKFNLGDYTELELD
jgi:glucose-1-phosphate thymidylyltransferase